MLIFGLTIKMKAPMWGQNFEPWEVTVLALCSAFYQLMHFVAKDGQWAAARKVLCSLKFFYCCWVPRAFLPQNFMTEFIVCCSPGIILTLYTHTIYLSALDFIDCDPPSFIGRDYLLGKTNILFIHTQGWPKMKNSIFGQKMSCGWLPCRLSEPTNLLHKWISEPTQPSQV